MPASHVISTMPMRELVHTITPPPPPEVVAAADDLHYRDYLTVALVVPESRSFPDNWIYIHATDVEVGRIQNYGSWSPYLVKDGRTCLGLEYFVFEGDDMWNTPDEELIALGTKELISLGLAADGDVERGYVVRVPKAYPYYDFSYKENVETIRKWIETEAPNIHPVGRNGMHKYNNQDHSMYTAMLTVENIFGADPRRLVGERRRGVPRGGVHRTRRPGAAATDCGARRARSTLADHAPDAGRWWWWHRWMTLAVVALVYLASRLRALGARLDRGRDDTHPVRVRGPRAVPVVLPVAGHGALPRAEPLLLDGAVPSDGHQPAGADVGDRPEHPAGPSHVDLGPGCRRSTSRPPSRRRSRPSPPSSRCAAGVRWTPAAFVGGCSTGSRPSC